MRTPGHDVELAAGYLVGEGDLRHPRELRSAKHCAGSGRAEPNSYNVLEVNLIPDLVEPVEPLGEVIPLRANAATATPTAEPEVMVLGETCGAAAVDLVRTDARWPVADDPVTFRAEVVAGLTAAVDPGAAGAAGNGRDRPGGLAVAAIVGTDGGAVVVRDDVAVRNAVDKVVGWATLQRRLPVEGAALVVAAPIGFDVVQRAVMAAIPVVVGTGSPSSLAVQLADDAGVTLVGNVDGASMDVFTRPDRILVGDEVGPTDPDEGRSPT